MEEVPTTILFEHPCQLGEGPTYDAENDTAWWFDILGRSLFEARIATGVVTRHDLPWMASALAVIDSGRQLIAAENGLHVRHSASGKLEVLLPLEEKNTATRSNDGRVHPCGAFWIGTMGRNAEEKAGSIYWFFRSELRTLYRHVTIPNAICFSKDGRAGYFADTRVGMLHRVELDPRTGLPLGKPANFYDHRRGEGGIDGATLDAEDHLWCARWGAGCVDRYSPEGERTRTVRVPASRPSCPVFVGKALDRLLVTTASKGMEEAAKSADPHHGKTFLLDVGVRGLPQPRVQAFAA